MVQARKHSPQLPPAERQQLADGLAACACVNFRKAARAITQLYDEALQPCGLRSTQLAILLSVATNPDVGISQLAREMVMDASTLNRNLRPLIRRGLISATDSNDGRRKLVSLSEEGLASLRAALPLWGEVQSQLVAKFGTQRYQELLATMGSLVQMTRG